MNIFYNAITGFLSTQIVICLNEVKRQITGIKAAKYSTQPCCDALSNPIIVYLAYDDYTQHPATGRRTAANI